MQLVSNRHNPKFWLQKLGSYVLHMTVNYSGCYNKENIPILILWDSYGTSKEKVRSQGEFINNLGWGAKKETWIELVIGATVEKITIINKYTN